ncbi:hypothetical protein ABID21_000917 [Pseudorhizobium tarimense]|uniref:Uncharacterized protein n=1 Tax=Pseudorhizobium tarimense TaxID=1079109 RepID=A0ABV2H2P8_9HYPH
MVPRRRNSAIKVVAMSRMTPSTVLREEAGLALPAIVAAPQRMTVASKAARSASPQMRLEVQLGPLGKKRPREFILRKFCSLARSSVQRL